MSEKWTSTRCQRVLEELRAADKDPWADECVYYYIGIAIELGEALQETTGYKPGDKELDDEA